MAKKVLYLGNNKWCYTSDCSQHAALIKAKDLYIEAVRTDNADLAAKQTAVLMASPEGYAALRHAQIALLTEKLGREPIIGLDLDGTTGDFTHGLREFVCSTGPVKVPRHLWKKHYPDLSSYDYHGEKGWFASREEFDKHFKAAEKEGLYKGLPIYPNASPTLQELNNYGVKIKVVTARNAIFNEDTGYWLKNHAVPYLNIFNPGHAKETVENVDVYLEDAPVVIKRLIDNEKKVLIMSQGYNKDLEPHKNTARSKDWTDGVVDKIFDLLTRK